MYWTLELASKLEDAPWPATKDELIETKAMSTRALRRYGPTIRQKKTSFSTRMSIKR